MFLDNKTNKFYKMIIKYSKDYVNISKLSLIDEPILVETNKVLKYLPLTPAGRFCSIDLYNASKFSRN